MKTHLQHLGFINSQAYEVMVKFNKGEMHRVPHAYMELLSRVWAASKGLIKLLDDIEDTPELEFSAGLIIRTMILDFFISLRGYDIKDLGGKAGKSEEQIKDELEAYFNTVLGDGLKLSANHFARMERNGHISEGELHNILNNLTVRYGSFLQPYVNDKVVRPIFGSGPRNDELFDQISANPDLKSFAQHFDAYAFYSKYEHFSIMSYDAFRRDVDAKEKTLKDKVEILVLHTFKVIGMLLYYINDGFLEQKYAEIGEYIGKNILGLNDDEISQMMVNS